MIVRLRYKIVCSRFASLGWFFSSGRGGDISKVGLVFVIVGVTRLPRIQQRRSLFECIRRLDRKGHNGIHVSHEGVHRV